MPVFTLNVNEFTVEVGADNDQTDSATGAVFAIEEGQGVAVGADFKGFLSCAASGIAELPCRGIATTRARKGDMLVCKRRGAVRGVSAITAPGHIYASNTPGAFSTTAGDTSQIVGEADETAGEFFFEPVTTGTADDQDES
jgi:hypothetical protein